MPIFRFVTPRDKPFSQRTCTALNYPGTRFQKEEEAHLRTERAPAFNLKSKLLRARIAILSSS